MKSVYENAISDGNGNEKDDELAPIFVGIGSRTEITVLVVDDDPDLLDLTASFLKRERDEFSVEAEPNPEDALSRLRTDAIDVIVSDYDMPQMNGLEFLEAVREEHEDIPFILFTGKGSEEIASKAISKGVTDYLQKGTDSSQYSLLANRIANAFEQYEAREYLKQSQQKFSKLVTNSSDMLAIVNPQCRFEYISPVCEEILGYEQRELIGECAFDYMPVDDRQHAMEEFFDAIENPDKEPVIESRFKTADDDYVLLEVRGKNMLEDDLIDGFVANGRDISALKEREQELKQQNEQLKDMRKMISHDIRNPLSVASNSMVLYEETGDDEHLDRIKRAIERIDSLVDRVLMMAKHERTVEGTEQVSLTEVAERAWGMVGTETDRAELHIVDSRELDADPSALQQAFENLFVNAIEHTNGDLTVRVGTMEGGIYVEDTGQGIPEDARDRVFESGYTTNANNTGFGLNIVKQIVMGHGWDIEIAESEEGGTRFEITGITFRPTVYE
jgi:PAS domain S-box-containing protein